MNEHNRKWNLNVLSEHNSWMYNELLFDHHITSESLKRIEFDEGFKDGYFARKSRTKYFIDKGTVKYLPIMLGNQNETLIYREDVVKHPLNPIPFKILPEKKFDSFREMIDNFCNFEHTQPKQWTLLKLLSVISYVTRMYVCISSNPEFGKSGIYQVINSLTDICPVFKPRSVPGVLNKINGNGNMVFDDVLESKKEVREIMEEFCLSVGGGASVYINGAMKSNNTKNKYDVHNQSITFTFNDIGCYKDKNKYFENMFHNNQAIDTRFVKLRLNGKLVEQFNKDFDLKEEAKENRQLYVNFAKHLLWLQDVKTKNMYELKYKSDTSILNLTGRKKHLYHDILWIIDMYCNTQSEFNEYIKLLDYAIIEYKEMVSNQDKIVTDEEYISE